MTSANEPANDAPLRLLLKVPEAAIALGLSEPTVWRLVRTGVLTSMKIGGSRLIPVEQVQRWIADETAEQMAERFGERRVAS